MNKEKKLFLFRLLELASLIFGIYFNISYASHFIMIISYYTLQINMFCLIVTIVITFEDFLKRKNRNNFYYILKGEMLISMFLMLLVYVVALSPTNFQMYSFKTQNKLANILVHIVSPLMVIFEYILFDNKGYFKPYYPLVWLIGPSLYVVYVYTYSAYGGRFYNIGGSRKYAYLFLDYEKYGKKVILFIICMAVGILLLGYILNYIDKKLAKK